MPTFKLTLAYDGTGYAGWQIQPGKETVQSALEATLARITSENIRVAASGRTDAGVHALAQVVSFSSSTQLSAETLRDALNAELPADMAALSVELVHDGFHACRDAVSKCYRYWIHDGPCREIFQRQYCWHCRYALNAAAMQRAAVAFVGTHDFRSFESKWPQRASSVRTIFFFHVQRGAGEQNHLIQFEVAGNGFLYNMVRAMVGTLVEVGRGARAEDWPAQVLLAQDRKLAGMTAPPQGLFLVNVQYDALTDPPRSSAE